MPEYMFIVMIETVQFSAVQILGIYFALSVNNTVLHAIEMYIIKKYALYCTIIYSGKRKDKIILMY